jgi:DNA-binding ferritin-like protein
MTLSENLQKYLEACSNLVDTTLDDCQERVASLDGSDIGILLDDYYTGADMLYDEMTEGLDDLIERVGGQTPINNVLSEPDNQA